MSHWYAIKTKPKREEGVGTQLKKASFEVFYPKIKAITSHRKIVVLNKHFTTKPLFPTYLFVRTNFDDPSIHRMIRYTRGVNRILGNVEGPQPISEIIIQTLMERTNSDGLLEQELLYRKGDEIIVKKGILKDLVGIVEKNLSDDGRVKILFKWLQGTFRAEVPYHDLEKVA